VSLLQNYLVAALLQLLPPQLAQPLVLEQQVLEQQQQLVQRLAA
jgi:hypothetical protein